MMRTIVGLAKPAYASLAASVPDNTAAAMASTDAVSMGNAPITTDRIVAAKIAKRCHAWGVTLPGGGMNQIATATARLMTRAHRLGLGGTGPGGAFVSGAAGCGSSLVGRLSGSAMIHLDCDDATAPSRSRLRD